VGLLAGLIFEVLLLPALLLLTAGLPWTWRSALGLRRGRGGARELGPSRLHTPAPPLPLADIEPTAPVVERRVLVCHGDKCKSAGAARIWRRLRNEQGRIAEAQPELGLRLTKTSCLGPCRFAPVVQIYPEGTAYGLLDDVRLDTVIDEHLRASRPVRRWALPALGTSPKR
jgi:(2Fe-2S) ferredoxin